MLLLMNEDANLVHLINGFNLGIDFQFLFFSVDSEEAKANFIQSANDITHHII